MLSGPRSPRRRQANAVLVSGASNRPLLRQVVCIQQRSLEGSVDYPTPAVTGCLIDPGWRLMTSFDCSALTT